MSGTSADTEAVSPPELERLRRRLYVPAASADDLAAYEDALARMPAPPAPPRERAHLRLPGGLAWRAGALALLVLLLGGAVVVLSPRLRGSEPEAGSASFAPPLDRRSSSFALTASNGVQRSIDTLFFSGSNGKAATAFGELDDLARHVALPGATDGTMRNSSTGDGTGTIEVRTAPAPLPVPRGSLLLFSVVAQRPTVAVWRLSGWRSGEAHRPHVLLVVRPAGEVDRLLIGAVRVPADMTVTAVQVTTDPTSAVYTRLELHDAAACRRFEGQQCPSAGG